MTQHTNPFLQVSASIRFTFRTVLLCNIFPSGKQLDIYF